MISRLKSRYFALIASAVLCVFPSSVAAQNIVVRAGAHTGFSRLVFQFDRETPWSLKKREGGYSVHFDNQALSFDFSKIFRFISKNRITSVASESDLRKTVVLINVQCVCHVDFFAIGTDRLVVDIVDGQADESVLPFENDIPDASAERGVLLQDIKTLQKSHADLHLQPNEGEAIKRPNTSENTAMIQQHQLPVLTMPLILPDVRVEQAQNELIEHLGRAMSHGVVQGNILDRDRLIATLPQKGPDSVLAADPEHSSNKSDISKTEVYEPADHLNFKVENVFDRDRATRVLSANANRVTLKCLEPEFFELATWGTVSDFPDEIGQLRSGLIGELDHVDVPTFEKLVRLYIANGFGLEAIGLMQDFKGVAADEEILSELAELLESGRVLSGNKLARQFKCKGAAILWGTSALEEIPIGETPDFDEIKHLFTELPKEIRRRIGPVLGRKYLAAGFVERAAEIADLVTRAPGEHGPDFKMFAAELDFAFERISAARAKLVELINENSENASDALILLLRSYISHVEIVPEILIAEAGARALEMRYSSVGEELRMLELEARAQAQDQAAAFEILVHETKLGLVQNTDQDEIVRILFQSFDALKQPPERLLETFFKYSYFLTTSPEMDPSRRQLAAAFLRIGLPQTALEILSVIGGRMTNADKIALAKIELSMNEPDLALLTLTDLQSEDAKTLRARAYTSLGQFDQALLMLPVSGDPLTSENIAWKAGRFDLISDRSVMSRRESAAYVLDPHAIEPESGSMNILAAEASSEAFRSRLKAPKTVSLQGLKTLLDDSKLSRSRLDEVLADHPQPE